MVLKNHGEHLKFPVIASGPDSWLGPHTGSRAQKDPALGFMVCRRRLEVFVAFEQGAPWFLFALGSPDVALVPNTVI